MNPDAAASAHEQDLHLQHRRRRPPQAQHQDFVPVYSTLHGTMLSLALLPALIVSAIAGGSVDINIFPDGACTQSPVNTGGTLHIDSSFGCISFDSSFGAEIQNSQGTCGLKFFGQQDCQGDVSTNFFSGEGGCLPIANDRQNADDPGVLSLSGGAQSVMLLCL